MNEKRDISQQKRKFIEYDYDEKTGLLQLFTNNVSLKELDALFDTMRKHGIDVGKIKIRQISDKI